MKILTLFFSVIITLLIWSCASTRLDNPQTCDKKLQQALSIPTNTERVTELKERVKRCPTHVPTLLATAKLYTEMTKEADENWLKLSIQYYKTVIDSIPSHVEAHWGLASVLEYIGEYDKAAKEYQWVIDNTWDAKQEADARVHRITCTFLDKNSKKKPQTFLTAKDSVDTSPEAIKKYSGWDFLKEMIASVAVAGGITALKGDGQHVQYALGLLYDWIDAPQGQSVQARNRFLSGMVSTLASIITKQNLNAKLGRSFNPANIGLPDAEYAGQMENDFKSGQPDEGRTFNVSDDLTVTEKWDVPDLSGTWDCIFSDCLTLERDVPGNCPCVALNSYARKNGQMHQTGKRITLVFDGHPDHQYNGEINGRNIEMILQYTYNGRVATTVTLSLSFNVNRGLSGKSILSGYPCKNQWTVTMVKIR